MVKPSKYASFVDSWAQTTLTNHSAALKVKILTAAFDAVWKRSYLTLGEVTLTAIVERILHGSENVYPWMSQVSINVSGICLKEVTRIPPEEIQKGLMAFVIIYLEVLGKLTADALTDQLHHELTKITKNSLTEDTEDE